MLLYLTGQNMKNNIKKIPTGRSVHGNKSKRIGLILEENLIAELDQIAKAAGVSRNSVIIHAVKTLYKIKESSS